MDWKETLNLPKTSFPMKANLVKREPEFLEFWEKNKIYEKMIEKRKEAPEFILHDGPPYANGHIHMGTALNKVLKDIIVKSRCILGYKAPYVPGWDCHGLPIELKVEQELGVKRGELPPNKIRSACREYAWRFINIQREEFKRLGVFGFWDKPYLTMDYSYEATIAREFLRFLESGQVYRRKKPVFWCYHCVTSLAEAEVEYYPHKSHSIYVKFPFSEELKKFLKEKYNFETELPLYALIWTTTPWTIPANLALALNPEYSYVLIKWDNEIFLVAEGRVSALCAEFNRDLPEILIKINPEDLEKKEAIHPIYEDRKSLFILADFVTLESGTGVVHSAPGHGEEDYYACLKYGIEPYVPVDKEGRFYEDVPLLGGLPLKEVNERVIELLEEKGHLLSKGEIEHSYPHCWRCKKPVIFRAEDQWFISMEAKNLRQKALEALKKVKFVPEWGRNRITSMIESRPDWCISRQRVWGVPITVFKCKNCGEYLKDFKYYEKTIKILEKEGCDPWFEKDVDYFLEEGTTCPKCGGKEFEKEKDILDVWFDSGVSFAAVLEKREELRFPADLYLEGSDQHRGWFHSSLLCSVGTRGVPPYRGLLTHGFVVDAQGRKMSKSLGNVIHPQDLIKKYGAEIVRLWVSAEDYKGDIKLSQEILNRLVEAYRKIRNTFRFLLGNLYDFNPKKDLIPFEKLPEFEKYILYRLNEVLKRMKRAYEEYDFHIVYQELHKFCVIELSSLLIDINRDYLYCELPESFKRRATQTVFYYVIEGFLPAMAPILSFTAEDIWQNLPYKARAESVFLTDFKVFDFDVDEGFVKKWKEILKIREEFLKALEIARKDRKIISTSLEAEVFVDLDSLSDETVKELLENKYFWEYFLMIAKFERGILEGEEVVEYQGEEIKGLKIYVKKTEYKKCERCWQRKEEVGTLEEPELCKRCFEVVKAFKK